MKKHITLDRVIILVLALFIGLQQVVNESISSVKSLKVNPNMESGDLIHFLTSLEIAKKNRDVNSFNNLEINFLENTSSNSVSVECTENSMTKKDLKILVPKSVWNNTSEEKRSTNLISIMINCLSNKKQEKKENKAVIFI